MLYDVFICHASADKAGFVSRLVKALDKANVEVVRQKTLKLGNSIRRTIDKGLSKSRFGIVVLSKAFFARNWRSVRRALGRVPELGESSDNGHVIASSYCSRRSDHRVNPGAGELTEIADLHPIVANERPKNVGILG